MYFYLDVFIKLNGKQILEKETSQLFAMFENTSLQERKLFHRFLVSSFFAVKEGEVLAELFKKLYQRFSKHSPEQDYLSCNGKTLLLRQPNERILDHARQVKILSDRINALIVELGNFFKHNELLNGVRREQEIKVAEAQTAALSAEDYDKALAQIQEEACSPPRLMKEMSIRYEQYLVTGKLRKKETGARLAALKDCISATHSMLTTICRIEEINYENTYGVAAGPRTERPEDEAIWRQTFGALLRLWEGSETFDWPAYERSKQLIQANCKRFSLPNQLLFCQYIINYVIRGLKAGELGLEQEEIFWASFRLENELVTVESELSDLTYLNVINLLSTNGNSAMVSKFERLYLPLVRHKKKDVKWMADVIVAFNKGHFGQVLERLKNPGTESRNAEIHYTTRKFSIRLRSILATELLEIEHDLEDHVFADFRQASKAFSTHLSDARLASKSRYPDWYIEANQQMIATCGLIRKAHLSMEFERNYAELIEAVSTSSYLPRRQWFLDLLERVKEKNTKRA